MHTNSRVLLLLFIFSSSLPVVIGVIHIYVYRQRISLNGRKDSHDFLVRNARVYCRFTIEKRIKQLSVEKDVLQHSPDVAWAFSSGIF